MTSLERIPQHLKKYVVEQNYDRYTAEDQAVWRFVLRQLRHQLQHTAHSSYIDGLEKTGITLDTIPKISEMDKKLQEFGWGAVPVSGFIPPAAFMEFQAMSILPIASDMRTVDHILYTPAPDIVHEAAGHAPILIDPAFSNYLKEYADVASKAVLAKHDLQTYEAIRDLSDMKENPDATASEIQACEKKLEETVSSSNFVSEAGLLGRMNWWTAEYGLIGDTKDPKIFGAGLLSSIGESKECLSDHIEKITLSLSCIDYDYDITEKQPQLFVAPSFSHLSKVLQELADSMAYKRGGVYAVETAIKSQTVNTVQVDSELQISGKVVNLMSSRDEVLFFKMEGPTQISFNGKQLDGHGPDYHEHGYSSPLGRVKGLEKDWTDCNRTDLEKIGLVKGKPVELSFESGFKLSGTVKDVLFIAEKPVLASFDNCQLTNQGETFFAPDWGTFDMLLANKVDSVYSGPADLEAYGGEFKEFVAARVPQRTPTPDELQLFDFYQQIRDLREGESDKNSIQTKFNELTRSYQAKHSTSWLAALELFEIMSENKLESDFDFKNHLDSLASTNKQTATCIELGLNLLVN